MILVDTLQRRLPDETCHMFSDTDDLTELHQIAEKIGLERGSFQANPILPHYALTSRMRKRAIEAGAVPCFRYQVSRLMNRRGTALRKGNNERPIG